MSFIKNNIERVYIIEPKIFEDTREYLFENCDEVELKKNGILNYFVQDNQSKSYYGVIRGLHCQLGEHSQAKLVRVLKGRVLDVAVDIQKDYPTFGQYVATELSVSNHRQLYIPRGYAHGFSVLSEEAIFQYKCDNYYAPQAEGGILWNDPDIGIDWQIPMSDVMLSEKDKKHPLLKDICESL